MEIRENCGKVNYPYITPESVKNLDKTVENVVKLLLTGGLYLSVAESCTGGLLSQLITSVSGASQVYEMGLCAYANRIKHEFLDVPQEELDRYTAVSSQVALSMAKGIRKKSGADYGVSVTGIAGPTGGTPEQPVGTVYIGIAGPDIEEAFLLEGLYRLEDKSRESIRLHTAAAVFQLLEKHLQERN